MSKIAFVGENRLGLFLNSFDVKIFPVQDGDEALEKIIELSKTREFVLIITSEEYSDSLRDFLTERKDISPVIFMLPSGTHKGESISNIRDVVEKAVGIDILSKNKQ
ncbi:MAG: V-type ATP synthase subunit F [Caldisericaceae bacterium]